MGYTGIDDVEELVLCLLLVKHDAVWNVDYLHDCLTFERATFHLDIPFLACIRAIVNYCFFIFHYGEKLVFYFFGVGGNKVCETKLFVFWAHATIIGMTGFVHVD